MSIQFVMGDLANAILVNATLYEDGNATLIFEIQYKTIEVLQHTPILKMLVIHSTTAVFYNQVGNEFQIIKRDGGAQGVEIVEAR
jgi:hypothetical protein